MHRRLGMLTAGGAAVTPIGFRRSPAPISAVEGIAPVDLGQTGDGKLARRAFSVVETLAKLGSFADSLRGVDAILARNLEMLVIAARARRRFAPGAKLIYECLDIHRMLLSKRLDGRLLRMLESRLWRDVDLLLTSSPAFIKNYFIPRNFPSPIRLVENKVLVPEKQQPGILDLRPQGPPWRIGWFGMIRCQRSLEILESIARKAEGAVEVVIRGRPSEAVFDDFQERIDQMRHVRFDGPYRSADLPAFYGEVHFAWAIDYFEQGQNSDWLLPNRIYEGTLYGAVPIALANVETGNWLSQRGAGVVLGEPLETELVGFFRQLDDNGYTSLSEAIRTVHRTDLVVDRSECRALVEALCDK